MVVRKKFDETNNDSTSLYEVLTFHPSHSIPERGQNSHGQFTVGAILKLKVHIVALNRYIVY